MFSLLGNVSFLIKVIIGFMSHEQANLNSVGEMSRKTRMSRHEKKNFGKQSNLTSHQYRLVRENVRLEPKVNMGTLGAWVGCDIVSCPYVKQKAYIKKQKAKKIIP